MLLEKVSAPLIASRAPPAAGSGAVFQGNRPLTLCGCTFYLFFQGVESGAVLPFLSGLPRRLWWRKGLLVARLCMWTHAHSMDFSVRPTGWTDWAAKEMQTGPFFGNSNRGRYHRMAMSRGRGTSSRPMLP
jgi:hypothetical protein